VSKNIFQCLTTGPDNAAYQENELAHEKWCNALSAKFLCVFVLDRFGDFVSDQVIAPVREMVSQTLASLLIHMPRRSVLHVHRILLQMIQQENFIIPAAAVQPEPPATKGRKTKAKAESQQQKTHVWEIRHAGLLGLKYEVAVRSDLFDVAKIEGDDVNGTELLRGVVDAAVLGYVPFPHI
jgi:TATA-binding protein-associated factor